MHTLKSTIRRYIQTITFFSVVIILIMIVLIQIAIEQRRAYDMSERTLSQIEQVLEENQRELSEIRLEYRQTCIHNAEAIAYIIECNPDVVYQVEELKKIAEIMEVDEIHIFDRTGCIIAGTHPEYYGYTFDSGEQMLFFKPMLEDHSLQLVQDITPNTAEGKLMQYSALWSRSDDFIVQVGMEPVSVMKVTEKNELSYIFSLFSVSPDASYYAIDAETGEIIGATDRENVGKKISEIGLDFEEIQTNQYGFSADVNGQKTYCVFKKYGENYLGRVVSDRELYQRIPLLIIQLAAGLTVVALILSHAATTYMNKYVVEKIRQINEKLYSIENGNLEETIDVQSSQEFSELSRYLNSMIKSLLDNKRKLEFERDVDLLTGLYNRRGLDIRLTELFREPEKLGYSAVVMMDADGLKEINDTYGHDKGDIYLQSIAGIIQQFGTAGSLAARQSGDEFILFLYQYKSEQELLKAICMLECAQNQSTAALDDQVSVPLRFSLGYSLNRADATYQDLIREADQKMYENKRERKSVCAICQKIE